MIAVRLLPATVVGLILLFLAFPIVVVVVVSFSSATYLTFPPPAFGLRWYEAYFSNADWLHRDGTARRHPGHRPHPRRLACIGLLSDKTYGGGRWFARGPHVSLRSVCLWPALQGMPRC